MPEEYQGEYEVEKKTWKLVPEDDPLFPLKLHLPFPIAPELKGGILAGRGKPPVRRGLNNPLLNLKKQEAQEKEKERKRNLEYLKKAKIQDRMS